MKHTNYYKSGQHAHHCSEMAKLSALKSHEEKKKRLEIYNISPIICMVCGASITYDKRKNKFCSRSCSVSHNNASRIRSTESRQMTSDKMVLWHKNQPKKQIDKKCIICGKNVEKRKRKTCSEACKHEAFIGTGRLGGLSSAIKRPKRSKNEILFADLCISQFETVTTNDPIFQGWDADVLIHDHKVAILWNGDWHYREMNCYNHSLKQVQNRDSHKVKLIAEHGWCPYIIKDTDDHPTKPEDAFKTLLEWLENKLVGTRDTG